MAQTLAEITAQLVKVNAAIDSCLTTGQSYARPGLSLNRVPLTELMKMRTTLEKQERMMGSTGISSVVDSSGGNVEGEASEWGE